MAHGSTFLLPFGYVRALCTRCAKTPPYIPLSSTRSPCNLLFPYLDKLWRCPSCSRCRDRINLGLLRTYHKGGGVQICIPFACRIVRLLLCGTSLRFAVGFRRDYRESACWRPLFEKRHCSGVLLHHHQIQQRFWRGTDKLCAREVGVVGACFPDPAPRSGCTPHPVEPGLLVQPAEAGSRDGLMVTCRTLDAPDTGVNDRRR